jgi:ATP-dependent protease ClpP protease subunit
MNRRRREILAALAPAVTFVMERDRATDKMREATGRAEMPAQLRVTNLSDDTAEIMIYGVIGGGGYFDEGGVTSVQMSDTLKEIKTRNIHVRINSGGGDVFEGVAIHTLLSRHPATVTAFIDGYAASAASFIAMAADKVVAARNAMVMIHDGMTFTYGGPKTHERALDLLHKVSDNIADMYALKAGGTAEEWRALMSQNDEDGTWYTGTEALEAGLVDELVGQEESALPDEEDEEGKEGEKKPPFPPKKKNDTDARITNSDPVLVEEVHEDITIEDNIRAQDQAFALLAAFKFAA